MNRAVYALTMGILAGCSAEAPKRVHDPLSWVDDHWSTAMAACDTDVTQTFINGQELRDIIMAPECGGALDRALGIDDDSFGQLPHLSEETPVESHRLQLRRALFGLMIQDLGHLDDLDAIVDGGAARNTLDALRYQRYTDPSHYTRSSFRATLQDIGEVTGRHELQAALFNFVASTIEAVVYVEELHDGTPSGYEIDNHTRVVSTTGYNDGQWSLGIALVHEAAHPWLQSTHVVCPEGVKMSTGESFTGRPACDDTWAGAHGYAAGSATLLWLQADADHIDAEDFAFQASWDLHRADTFLLAD
jgi:hypothetical protein